GSPAAKLKVLVEEKGAGSVAVLHGQRGESLIAGMELDHAPEIDGADDIDVVQNERLSQAIRILEKEPTGSFQASACIEQDLLAGNFDAHAEVIVRPQIIENHAGQVMHIDDHFADSEGSQAGERDLQQGAAGDVHPLGDSDNRSPALPGR